MTPITRAHLRALAAAPDAHAVSITPGDLLELLDVTEWHPIETAPRNGTRVLVCFQDGTCWVYWFYGVGDYLNYVTHWRPLPSPPDIDAPAWEKCEHGQ